MTLRDNGSRLRTAWRILSVIVLLYLFMVGIKVMGDGCKAAQTHPFIKDLISSTENPFIGLFVGILVTSIIQSSSATTSIVVTLVATTPLTVRCAIPIVMGANIGTTVTNTLVSMGYVMRREEFRRAISGAIVHDLFNVMVVVILLPIELLFHPLEHAAFWLTGLLPSGAVTGAEQIDIKAFDPLAPILNPARHLVQAVLGKPQGPGLISTLTILVGLGFIFFALMGMVRVLKGMMLGKAESLISAVIGRAGWLGIIIGLLVTATVQSSSITTSVLVPMAAAGIVTVAQIFPITIGANIGTTVTALIGSIAASKEKGLDCVTIAVVHCLFNIGGLLIFYPLPVMRRIPVRAAETVGRFAANSRRLALLYVFAMFFGVPALLIFLYRWLF
jgi:sodium-dependent phosphate cotransporter